MRRLIGAAMALATALSVVSPMPTLAEPVVTRAAPETGAVDPLVLAIIKAFPSGGQVLRDRIRMLILQNHDFAAEVAKCLTSREVLSAAQREAVEKGLAEALTRLGIYAQVPDSIDPNVLFALTMLGVGGAAVGLAVGLKKNNNPSPLPLPVVSPH